MKQHSLDTQKKIDAALLELGIRCEMDETELNRIPKEGAFIVVCNHPFGEIDGLLLIKALLEVREDFKIFGNFSQTHFKNLNPFIDSIYPIDEIHAKKSNEKAASKAQKYLEEGVPIALFPSGEISDFDRKKDYRDKLWKTSIVRFIKKSSVPVVPIYLHSNQSAKRHFLKISNPIFRVFNKETGLIKNKSIKVRVGQPIKQDVQNSFKNVFQYGRFLRAKTDALGSTLEVKRFFNYKLIKQTKQEPIVEREAIDQIKQEIENIREDYWLFKSGKYDVFCTPSYHIPVMMNEIGRLREITFRDVGEGTNRSIDIDEFDLYYEQLFIWDTENDELVGAYRIGKGKDILKRFGKQGFYLDSLFSIDTELNPILEQSLELGRSFVCKSYQRNPVALFLLWKGILYLLLKNEEYRYLIGPVSISNDFSKFSKSMIISFIKSNYFHTEFAKFVKPRKKFKVDYKNIDHEMILESVSGDINKLDKMIEEVEPNHYRFPVLFKKYLKLNAKIMGFNVDPRFNMALDGLIILDLLDVPMNTIRSLSKELNDDSILERFQN